MKKTFIVMAVGSILFLGTSFSVADESSELREIVEKLQSKIETMQSRINELEGKNEVRDERLKNIEEQSTLAVRLAESLDKSFSKAGDGDAVKWFGDLRFRFEYENQSAGKGSSTAAPRHRDRYRVRARFGAKAHITENWFGEFRVATGGGTNLNSPHEDLGLNNQNLNNGPLKLDRVNIGYHFVDYHTKIRMGKFGLATTQ